MNQIVFNVLLVAGILVVAFVTYLIGKGYRALQAADRRKQIERQMRQNIIDANSERQIAAKLLKEAGQ